MTNWLFPKLQKDKKWNDNMSTLHVMITTARMWVGTFKSEVMVLWEFDWGYNKIQGPAAQYNPRKQVVAAIWSIRSWAMGSNWNETEEWNFAYDIPGYWCQEIYRTWTRCCCNTIWNQHVTMLLPLLRLEGKFSTNEHSEQQEWPLTHCIMTSVNRYSYTVRVWHWGQGLVLQ